MPAITYQEYTGEPIPATGLTITPIHKVLKIVPPGFNGGLVWNRPVAVRISSEDGKEQVVAVQDITRLAILFIAVFGLVFALIKLNRKTNQSI
jgi:hypothetical protein